MTRTLRGRLSAAVMMVAVAGTLLLGSPASAAAGVHAKIDAALSACGMGGAGTSVAVYDLTAKRYLYSLRYDTLRLPASNEKLITSATALADWTADYRFSTQLFSDAAAPDDEGVLAGDVYLRGLGDPTLSTASYQDKRFGFETSDLRDFVTQLGALGVTKITGRVVADEGYFDAERSVSTWRPSVAAWCAPLSALTLNESVGSNGSYVHDPALWAAGKLTKMLRAADIRVVHAATGGVAPATATLLCTEESAELGRILAAMNKPSDNFLAEELLKGLGAGFGGKGSTEAGAEVAAEYLKSAGVTEGYRIRDGSGLSYRNKLSAHAVVKLLSVMAKRDDFKVYWKSLAVAGVSGTLKNRMRGTKAARNVHAKTGTLSAASCLSGYVTSANRHALVFSVLINGSGLAISRAHAAQDRVAVILANAKP